MHGIKIEGIILKRRNLGEADRILTVFCYQLGNISVLAKGVRRITSRRGGNVELLNRTIMFLHRAKTFLILTEATTLNTYQKIKSDLTLSTYGYHIVELVDKLTAENQDNGILYGYLIEVLKRLERAPRQILIRAFEVKTLSNLGFMSFLSKNVNTTESENITDLLKVLETDSWDRIEKLEINQNQALELERTLRYYLERVIEGSLKSRLFLKDLRNG